MYQTRVRAARAANDVTRHSLSVPELTTVPGTFGDPLRVLQNLPGVSRAPYGLGLLIVRGAPPTDTGVFVGGQQIPQLYHFLVGPSVIAPHLIERVDFFPGGFGVRYGRASGGAVDVQLKEGPATGFHGGADLSVLDVSAFAEGPLHGGRSPGTDGAPTSTTTATVAVRRSTIDALLPLVVPRQQGSTFVTTVPVYWDYQARVVHDFGGTRGRIGLMAFGSDDTLKLVSQDPQAGDFSLNTHNGFHRVIAYWAGSIAGWTGRLSPAYGNGEDSFSIGSTSGFIRYQRAYLRADASRPLGARVDVRLGFDGLYSYDTGNFDIWYPREGRNFGTATLERQRASRALIDWAPAAFVETELRPHPALRIVPGLRFDAYHVIGMNKFSWDPRLSIRWSPVAPWTFKAGAGLYHQLPTGQFMDREFGNPNLKLIWTEQYAVGVERTLGDRLRLDATAYVVRRHDLPVPSVEHFSSTGRGRAWGLEVLLKHDVTAHVFGWLAYTLSWSQQTGRERRGDDQRHRRSVAGGRPSRLAAERVRSAPQPDRGRQLPPLGVAIRRPLPVGVGPPHHHRRGVVLRRGFRWLHADHRAGGAHVAGAIAHVQPAGPARGTHVRLRCMDPGGVPRRAEHLQRAEPRELRLRLPVSRPRPGARPPDPAGDRVAGEVLMAIAAAVPTTVRRLALLLGLTATAAGGGGCTSFADPSTVTDLRVLAVRSEPSEIILHASTLAEANAAVIPDIVLEPLLADPAGGGRPLAITVSACANDPSAASPPNNGDDPTGFPAGGARTTVGSALCDGAATELLIAADVDPAAGAPIVARLPAAWVADAFMRDVFVGADRRPHGGFDLGMPVVFQVTVHAGAETVKALKRVTFWLQPLRDDQVPNQSPLISAVSAYARRDEASADPLPDAIVPLEAGTPLAVPDEPDDNSGLWIDPAPAQAEPYVTAVIDRLTGEALPHDVDRETVRYTFFATAGTFDPFETSSEPPPGVMVPTRVHIESKYKPPPLSARPSGAPLDVTIWIVARDERGGASWVTRTLRVSGAP